MKKISILVLHLGYGGVEKAITNLANMLCNDYKVEIISIYKLYNKPVFELDKKVNVKYLLENIPNKNDVLNALKKGKLFTFFKEGFKSAKILFNKKYKMIKAIQNCDADIIISSRIYLSKLLVKYGKKDVIKIAQEHRHHNNEKKYINDVVSMAKGIDYLMPVSKELTNFFKELVSKDKCLYISHCIDYIPETSSKLTEKRIVAIGRLSSGKGYLDLIDVFSIVNKKHPDWKLDIVGDGDEKTKITYKINELGLNDNVNLHGYRDKEYINSLLEKSSIFVMTSLHESFGLVLLEAGSFGIPSVVFDSARGALEIIKHNDNGLIIKKRDIKKMANSINKLIESKKNRMILGEKARENSYNYSFDVIKDKWLNFLNNIKPTPKESFKSDNYNISNILFIFILVLIMILGFTKVMLKENNYNMYENRYSVKMPTLSFKTFFNKEYQNNIDLALADQLPKYDIFKKVYNLYDGVLAYNFVKTVFKDSCENSYVPVAPGVYTYDCTKYLVYPTTNFEKVKDTLDKTITNYNEYINKYKDIDFYIYYINKDTDINFTNNDGGYIYNYLKSNIVLDEENISSFQINSFDEYKNNFYMTDHHWDYRGSYRGYTEIIGLLKEQPKLLKPIDVVCLDKILFGGSKSRFVGGKYLFNDKFCGYKYDLPEYKTYINGELKEDGNSEGYFNNPNNSLSYGNFYGWDDAEILFDFNNPNEKNLLIISESFSNANNELIASHFNKTYDIDLRQNKDFKFDTFVKEKEIDIVLFMGNSGLFISTEFILEG